MSIYCRRKGPTVFASPGNGFGSGWDVILPSVWAREMWHVLVNAGAKTCGLRDLRQLHLEQVASHGLNFFLELLMAWIHMVSIKIC